MVNVLVWGIGRIYNQCYWALEAFERKGVFNVVGICSNTQYLFEKIDGRRVYNSNQIDKLEVDYIIIMSDQHWRDIYHQVLQMGYSEDVILSYRMLFVPNLDFFKYIQLKNSKISIISNNCWGGLVYHSLGLECNSPFKNMFVHDEDYLKIVQNIECYLEKELVYFEMQVDIHSKKEYPVFKLGDVKIHCNHAKDIQSEIINWERRVKKVNRQQLLFEMYTTNIEIAKAFMNIDVKNKICFVDNESEVEGAIRLDVQENEQGLWDCVNRNASLAGYLCDNVELLLSQKIDYRIE